MKIFLFLTITIFTQGLPGQSVKSVLEAIVKNDQDYLDKNLASIVNYTLDQHSSVQSKQLIIDRLRTFIASAAIKQHKLIHEGVTKGKESFMGIGNLIADKGKYRIYITFTTEDGKTLVNDLRIEKDDL
jgi:hypothetical protein